LRTVSPKEAAVALRAGEVALVPTETVVGLVAAEPGLPRMRDMKGRVARKPIALLCVSAEEAFALADAVPPLARRLAELYWPGPLTLVLDRPGGGTVGVRVPAGPAARESSPTTGSISRSRVPTRRSTAPRTRPSRREPEARDQARARASHWDTPLTCTVTSARTSAASPVTNPAR